MGYLVASPLIAHFLWNLLTPAHEFQVRSTQIMTIMLDVGMTAGLFGFRAILPEPLFVSALISGIGLLTLRPPSDQGWWTGHLVFYLSRR
ncbi:MAG: hypothetical protein JSS22_11285 [Proteobacteria bacterium]|nr:hypothetical protein [Pseudomonadota bacterium]